MVLRQQVARHGRPYVLTQKSCLLTQNVDLLSHKKVLRSDRKGGSRRYSVRAAMLGSPLQSTAALTQEGLAQMIMPPSILAFSNPFVPAKPAPTFFESLTSNPIETLTQNPLSTFHVQGPSFFSILGFLLANPLISLLLAVALYILIPRLWKALVKFVFIPAGVLGAGFVVFKNPGLFLNAGSAIAGFSTDHPYVTSAAILGTIGILLSPYVLTGLILLLVFTGVPNLPAPLRGFLPTPVLEVEDTLRSADQVIRGPVDAFKQQAIRAGDDFRGKGFDFLGKQLQSAPDSAALPESASQR